MWQRSTLSRAGSAQGSRNAHFIDWNRGKPSRMIWYVYYSLTHLTYTVRDITVRFETCHRRHRPHRSHSSHTTHRVSRKRLDLDQKHQSETYTVSYTVNQMWIHCCTASILHRETRLNTNYNDWMTKIRNIAWKQHFYTYIASTAFNQ